MENPISIENQVEGPHLKIGLTLSKDDLLKQMPPNNMPQVATRWIYDQIEGNLPEGEVKTAFHLAYAELKEKTKQGKDKVEQTTLVPGSDRYAFRGILRKSDNTPGWEHPESTLSKMDENLFNSGIDAPGSEENILPGVLWHIHAFPTPIGLKDRGEDITEIFIYRNESFVLPTKEGDEKTIFVNMKTGEKKQIDVTEALEKKYPTLRDIFVGQIEVRFV